MQFCTTIPTQFTNGTIRSELPNTFNDYLKYFFLTCSCMKINNTPLRLLTTIALSRALDRADFILPAPAPVLSGPGHLPAVAPVVRRYRRLRVRPRLLVVSVRLRNVQHGLVAVFANAQVRAGHLLGDVVQVAGGLAAQAVVGRKAGSGFKGGFLAQTVVRFDVGVPEESKVLGRGRFRWGFVLSAGQVAIFVLEEILILLYVIRMIIVNCISDLVWVHW